LAGGEAVISDLSNPNEASLDLPAGTVSASVAAAGTTDPVIGPADVPVVAGQSTIVYAIGSLEEGNHRRSVRHRWSGRRPRGLVPAAARSRPGVARPRWHRRLHP